MDDALEEIEFLVRSPNRVAVLRLVAEERQTRSSLAAGTGASQATLGRILDDFEDRTWIESDDGGYVATATGRLVSEGVSDLLEVVETEQKLRDVVGSLPTEELGFDLARLADATVTTPSETRPNAPVQRLLDLIRTTRRLRVFSYAFNEQTLSVVRSQVSDGHQRFEGVFSRSAIEAVAEDSVLRERLASLLEAEASDVRICSQEIPLAVSIADDVVFFLVRDDDGLLRASVDTADPEVHAWAMDLFESYQDEATPLHRSDLQD